MIVDSSFDEVHQWKQNDYVLVNEVIIRAVVYFEESDMFKSDLLKCYSFFVLFLPQGNWPGEIPEILSVDLKVHDNKYNQKYWFPWIKLEVVEKKKIQTDEKYKHNQK